MPLPLTLVGPSAHARSWAVGRSRAVNLYAEIAEGKQGTFVASLLGTPGLKRFCTLPGTGNCRGLHRMSNSERVFAVQGAGLYEVFAEGTTLLRGTLQSAGGPVSMDDNGLELILVDGARGYAYTLAANTFAPITDEDFPGASRVAFIDGYIVFNHPGTGQFGISGLYQGTVYAGADFATAEGSPDPIRSLLTDHRELWIFGTKTTEVFYNSGNPDFPFDRFQGAYLEEGIVAPHAAAKLDNSVFWPGENDQGEDSVWRATGYQPQRVSTHAVEYSLGQEPHKDHITAWSYRQEGHSFYVMNLTDTTWVFDAATGLWHERQSMQADGTMTRWRAQWHAAAWQQHLVGDYQDGRLYTLRLDWYTEDTAPLVAERTFPPVSGDGDPVVHSRLELRCDAGVGLDGGVIPGTDPQVMLQWSDTDGQTWSNEHWRSLGRQGRWNDLVHWDRLGQAYDRLYKVRITDPVKRAIVGAYLWPSKG